MKKMNHYKMKVLGSLFAVVFLVLLNFERNSLLFLISSNGLIP
ncbi:hypothetical protein [Enterococcus ureasiticus]|nr:hypothetical protein [Enterococcus ureasiticus]